MCQLDNMQDPEGSYERACDDRDALRDALETLYLVVGLYRHARQLAPGHTLDEAAELLMLELPDRTPDGAPYTLSSVRAALCGIR